MALISPKCIGEPELCSRSEAPMSDRQGTTTANRQNQRKLNFKPYKEQQLIEVWSSAMHGYISDLHWVMPQCTYLIHTVLIPYMESHNWMNAKYLTSCVFPNAKAIVGVSVTIL